MMKSFRNACSLILAAPRAVIGNHLAYDGVNIITLKRSVTSNHFPSFHVFPGGNCDDADCSSEWLSVLPSETLDVPLNIAGQNLETVCGAVKQQVPEAVSLRITAIRETFEESGILLCRLKKDFVSNSKVVHLKLSDANAWRMKISHNAREFINLCRTHECFPDIKGLYLLSCWITPVNFKRRYDCKFFIAAMDKQVEGEPDGGEIESIEWNTMDYFLRSDNVLFPPPQIYETSRLKQFQNIESLVKFAFDLNSLECEPFIPVGVNADDGLIIILPGDEKYLDLFSSKSSENSIEANSSMQDYRGRVMHRIEIKKGKGTLIMKNCSYRNHDLLNTPLSRKESKL